MLKGQVIMMWWKRFALGTLIVLLACSAFCAASSEDAVRWRTYVTADGYVSFDYPDGWVVQENESGFMIYDQESYEQLWLVILGFERTWTALEHAEYFIALIQEETPEMQGTNWESDQSGDMVLIDLQHGTGQKSAQGYALVVKDNEYEQTLWFHYLANRDMFNEDRALSILGGFANSLASSLSTAAPAGADAKMERIARNVDGFLFVLEFALGSPLTLAEETLIGAELKGVLMDYSDDELLQFDDFPLFVEFLMTLNDPEDLAEMKVSLQEVMWEWVEESDPDDPIVNLVREAMLEADRVLVPGGTALTEVAAMAYAELFVFAEHLGNDGAADLRAIPERRVQEIKEQLVEAWPAFSQEEKEQVLEFPAVWTTLRRALSLGDEEDREHALRLIRSAIPQENRSASSNDESYDPIKWINYQTTLQIQNQTFNHYMWSVGYNKTIYGF
ncbi:MAG TPA: hypothetical protein GXZ68_04685 [Firmicutes bacterium]|jgi:hypothetical protein|nr:hypothetical protein [Bacillota bacterium]